MLIVLSPYIPTCYSLFFFNDTATTEIYTLSLHDALPISERRGLATSPVIRFNSMVQIAGAQQSAPVLADVKAVADGDRKSTRLNSSHMSISYAVFCLKKKKYI